METMKVLNKEKTLEFIAQTMKKKKIKQYQIAEVLHVSSSCINHKLHGEREFTLQELLILANVFELDLFDILQFDELERW